MYTTRIGRLFLKAYNDKFEKNYTAKGFFEKVFVPLFFDYPKYMMTAGNSPLENPKLSWEDMIKGKKPFETPEQRKERICKMIKKIESEKADASIAIGYGVTDNTAATTGQITSMALADNKDDIYFSWIGAGLGIGVTGALTILFDNSQLLLDIFEGWKYYRSYLEKNPLMKGNQINTWNGRWIEHRYSWDYEESDPTAGFNPLEPTSNGLLNLLTVSWVDVVLKIARKIPIDNMMGYLYNIGQTNTTIGFIPFKLQDIVRPNQLYEKVFGLPVFFKDRSRISKLYGTAMGLRIACQNGAIGIPAMEPKGLRAFFPTNKGVRKIACKDDEEQRITYNTYLIWILAMLNNEKLWDISCEFAKCLLNYEAGAGKARKDRTNKVNQLLDSVTSKQFIQNLIPIINDEQDVEEYENIGRVVHEMPKDNFPYFNTLIRFQYALLNK